MDEYDDYRYLTFPVCLLKDAFDKIKDTCDNIFDYAIYKYSLTLDGTERERMEAALDYYKITPGNLEIMTRNGKNLVNSIPDRSPLTSINKDRIFDFYKNQKSEFNVACFCAFAAIKSILGKKGFCKTNKNFIITRMFGYNSMKDVPKKKPGLLIKYSKRYYVDKVLTELQMDWHLNLFSDHCRGFYLSFDYSLEALARINIEAKKATKLNELRSKKKEALRKAKEGEVYQNKEEERKNILIPKKEEDQKKQPESNNKINEEDDFCPF